MGESGVIWRVGWDEELTIFNALTRRQSFALISEAQFQGTWSLLYSEVTNSQGK